MLGTDMKPLTQTHPPQGFLRSAAGDYPPVPPEQLHVRHQGDSARGGPLSAGAPEAPGGAL